MQKQTRKKKASHPKLEETQAVARRLNIDHLGEGALSLNDTPFYNEGSLLGIVHARYNVKRKRRK